jgi:hypothetical protein
MKVLVAQWPVHKETTMNNLYKKAIWAISLVLGLYGTNIWAAAPYIQQAEYSTDISYINNSPVAVPINYAILDNTVTAPSGSITPAPIREVRGAVIDGIHLDSAGLRYFSFDVDTRVNGFSVLKSDVIRCNDLSCATFNYFFDSHTLNVKHININAFSLDPVNGDLIFSIDSAAVITGDSYLASDLIRYDGTVFSLEYGPIVVTNIAKYRNIDALSYTDNGKYLVSFANDGVLNDIHEYDLASTIWSIAYTPTTLGDDYNPINISSLMITTQAVAELIFSDGFE